MTDDILKRLEKLTRGTTEAAPIGILAENLSLPTNVGGEDSDSDLDPYKDPPKKINLLTAKYG